MNAASIDTVYENLRDMAELNRTHCVEIQSLVSSIVVFHLILKLTRMAELQGLEIKGIYDKYIESGLGGPF